MEKHEHCLDEPIELRRLEHINSDLSKRFTVMRQQLFEFSRLISKSKMLQVPMEKRNMFKKVTLPDHVCSQHLQNCYSYDPLSRLWDAELQSLKRYVEASLEGDLKIIYKKYDKGEIV